MGRSHVQCSYHNENDYLTCVREPINFPQQRDWGQRQAQVEEVSGVRWSPRGDQRGRDKRARRVLEGVCLSCGGASCGRQGNTARN